MMYAVSLSSSPSSRGSVSSDGEIFESPCPKRRASRDRERDPLWTRRSDAHLTNLAPPSDWVVDALKAERARQSATQNPLRARRSDAPLTELPTPGNWVVDALNRERSRQRRRSAALHVEPPGLRRRGSSTLQARTGFDDSSWAKQWNGAAPFRTVSGRCAPVTGATARGGAEESLLCGAQRRQRDATRRRGDCRLERSYTCGLADGCMLASAHPSYLGLAL